MKSLYLDKKFAEFWNDRTGKNGGIYKRLILDPLMFKIAGSLNDKTILDLGCGNGYLAPKFVSQNPKKLILADISPHNLEFAKQKLNDSKIEYLVQDVTVPWKIDDSSIDAIYSNLMFNEIESIDFAIKEAFRTLNQGGKFIFSVTHPSWDLFIYAQEKAGKESKKIKGLGSYFQRGKAEFMMDQKLIDDSELAKKYDEEFKVSHYHRTVADYFDALTKAGFVVKNLLEPELTEEFLKENSKFSQDYPIALIFACEK
jgi:SAM-dependent methyltransferase